MKRINISVGTLKKLKAVGVVSTIVGGAITLVFGGAINKMEINESVNNELDRRLAEFDEDEDE